MDRCAAMCVSMYFFEWQARPWRWRAVAGGKYNKYKLTSTIVQVEKLCQVGQLQAEVLLLAANCSLCSNC